MSSFSTSANTTWDYSQYCDWVNRGFSQEEALSVHTLYFSNYGLHRLPPGITLFKNLVVLDCMFNNLTEIPIEIGNLSNLRTLLLSGNKIRKFIPEIGYLTNLSYIHISDNEITEFIPELLKLKKLEIFYCSTNKINRIPLEYQESFKKIRYFYSDTYRSPVF